MCDCTWYIVRLIDISNVTIFYVIPLYVNK